MKAIKTTFHGPGNVRGSRCKATDSDGNSVYLDWNHSLDSLDNHRAAAYALCTKMQWAGDLITGSLKDCYVHVFKD
jgi:hypothetical protein